jgi:UDPglucose 6-dehydrogenase
VLTTYSRAKKNSFRVASNPEFFREGTAVEDFFHPDRIVVGVEDESAAADLREIYRPIVERRFHCPLHKGACPPGRNAIFLGTAINSAELIKHASNSFLAMKIIYANFIADLCEKLGGNVEEVTHAMGSGSPDWEAIPPCRARLWWLRFPKGCPSLHPASGLGWR